MVALGRRDWPNAERMLREALRARVRANECWLWLAYVAGQTENRALAEEARRELEDRRQYAPGQLFLAGEELRAGRLIEARRRLETLKSTAPGMAKVYEHLLWLDFLEEQWDSAAKHARELARRQPENPLAYFVRGYALHHEGHVEEAESAFRLSLAKGETAMVRHALAMIYSDAQRWPDALTEAIRAVELEPGNPVFRATRGMARSKSGDARGAADDYREALRRGGAVLPAIALNAVAILRNAGDIKAADDVLRGIRAEDLPQEWRDFYQDLVARQAEKK